MSSDQRVQIAQDVLSWLIGGKLLAKHGTYVGWEGDSPAIDPDKQLSVQLKNAAPCNVCAKGAAFIVAVDRFNQIQARDVVDIDREAGGNLNIEGDGFENFLTRFFEKEQIDQIEAAFEGWSPQRQNDEHHESNLYEDDMDELYDFSDLFLDKEHADVRLAMIMRNVVFNKGTFDADQFADEISHGYDHSVLELPAQLKK